jgi:hypothetical protein
VVPEALVAAPERIPPRLPFNSIICHLDRYLSKRDRVIDIRRNGDAVDRAEGDNVTVRLPAS